PKFLRMAERVFVTWSKGAPEQTGRDLADIAKEWGVDTLAAVARLQPAGAVYFTMDEGDVRRILSYPHTMIGSDGLPHDTHPHPRAGGPLPARARPLQPRREAVPARGGRAPHDRPAGPAVPPDQPRHHRGRQLRRPRGLRPGDGDRPRHLRGADDAGRRHRQ